MGTTKDVIKHDWTYIGEDTGGIATFWCRECGAIKEKDGVYFNNDDEEDKTSVIILPRRLK